MPDLLEERRGNLFLLTLHRPDRLNAVTEALYEALLDSLARAAGDTSLRAIVLTGAGRAFCVGADLKGHGETERDRDARRQYVELGQRAAKALLTHRCPIVAALNGHAIGAGLELALACDLSVVAESAKLRFPEFGLGTFVGGGATATLPARVGATRARQLLLLGRFFSGAEAAQLDVCNLAVPTDEVVPQALALAEELATKAPRSIALAKQLLHAAPGMPLDDLLAAEAEALLACMATRDWQEGIDAFAARRQPDFTGD
ncbi:MAG TPA: enoyl-CoA hydratase/isomerase family protein [Planctomycetota bacterium]|nr:enoyl-CoA hydratase/isomerase family protein [Planctomycetota bacterium]